MPSEETVVAPETQAVLTSIERAALALADAQGPATAREQLAVTRAASPDALATGGRP